MQRWEAKEDELRKAENERTEVIHEDRQNTERQDSVSGDLTVCLMDVDELDASRESIPAHSSINTSFEELFLRTVATSSPIGK